MDFYEKNLFICVFEKNTITYDHKRRFRMVGRAVECIRLEIGQGMK